MKNINLRKIILPKAARDKKGIRNQRVKKIIFLSCLKRPCNIPKLMMIDKGIPRYSIRIVTKPVRFGKKNLKGEEKNSDKVKTNE